jgi:uncharacterized protein (DUF2141 family)
MRLLSRSTLLPLSIFALFAPVARSAAADNAPVPEAAQPDLRVQIAGVKSAQGHVRVDVCAPNEFLKECHFGAAAPAAAGVTTVLVRDLPPGVYAVQAYHDRNDNHAVDRNVFGLPTEAVGFSNDAPIRLSPPSFKSAAFDYSGGEKTITFKLRYFGK